jgi:hypothetical protein
LSNDIPLNRLKFHSILLVLEGFIAMLFMFVESKVPTLFPMVLYTYGMNGALSTAVLLFAKHFKAQWYWVLLLHILGLIVMFGLSILVFLVFTPRLLDILKKI